jgi:hypothetical protein
MADDVQALGICGVIGRAKTFVCGDVGFIPTCGVLKVWLWIFSPRTGWLVNDKSAGQHQFSMSSVEQLTFPFDAPSRLQMTLGTQLNVIEQNRVEFSCSPLVLNLVGNQQCLRKMVANPLDKLLVQNIIV